jgi:hypothetical protein
MKAPRAIVAMLLGTLAFAGLAQAAERAEKPGKIDLKIPVQTLHPCCHRRSGEVQARLGQGHDVVILDYDGDGFKAPRVNLPRSYARSTVTVGVVGAIISGDMGLKTGYL